MGSMSAQEFTAWRERRGLSQIELARELGVHPMTVSKWERGKHRIPELVLLAVSCLEARQMIEGLRAEVDEYRHLLGLKTKYGGAVG